MSVARTPSRTRPNTAGWIAIIIFIFLAGIGTIAALATVALFTSVNSNLASPADLKAYVLPEETVILDRTGQIELARFGEYTRDLVTFDEIPKVLLDATTANAQIGRWVEEVAHQRVHGTTGEKPAVRLELERLSLLALPMSTTVPVPASQWRQLDDVALPIESLQHPLAVYEQLLEAYA
jgi:hypothetical protein